MKYLEDPQVFKSKGDDYDGLFTLPSKYATILPFQIGKSVTLEGRLARVVRRTLISINVLAKDNDKHAFFLCNCLDNVKVQPTKNGNGANIMTSSVLNHASF